MLLNSLFYQGINKQLIKKHIVSPKNQYNSFYPFFYSFKDINNNHPPTAPRFSSIWPIFHGFCCDSPVYKISSQ